MRRRLRKKLRVGEFEQWLMAVVIHFRDELAETAAFDRWLDSFIDLLEARGLSFGGGGKHPLWSGAIDASAAGRIRVTLDDYEYVSQFLEHSDAILGYRLGPILRSSEYCRLLDQGEFDQVFADDIPEEHLTEIKRRIAEIERGEAELIPWEEVKARLLADPPKPPG